jgi:biopolymer transport protein ExbB
MHLNAWKNAVLEQASGLWEEASTIWLSGGWAMIAIAVIGLVMFGLGMNLWVRLRAANYKTVPERTWRRWLSHPEERRGRLGSLLDDATGAHSLEEAVRVFEQVRSSEVSPFERDLKVLRICVTAAPLVGLLGTVTGMLTTFAALSTGSGGDQTMGQVAGGISEALITTETGLVIALPGLFFQYQLMRHFERIKAFLAHVESVCTQALYRRTGLQARAG